jgi:hypothetical protein
VDAIAPLIRELEVVEAGQVLVDQDPCVTSASLPTSGGRPSSRPACSPADVITPGRWQ